MKKFVKLVNSIYLSFGKRLFHILIGLFGTIFIFLPSLLIIGIFYQFGKNKGPIFF